MSKASIVRLDGGGDTNIFVVPEEIVDWFDDVRPGSAVIPQHLREKLVPYLAPKTHNWNCSPDEEFNVTSGSSDNDAAIFMSMVVRNFDTESEAEAWVYENGLEVSDVRYDGYIY